MAGGNPLAVGLMLLALVYIGKHISGSYYNPALAVAGYVRGMLSSQHLIGYLIAQGLGSLAALALFKFGLGVLFTHQLPAEVPVWLPLVIEVLFTFVFASVVVAVMDPRNCHTVGAGDRRVNNDLGEVYPIVGADYHPHNDIYGVAIGFTLVGLLAFGGMYNPAVALASMLLSVVTGAAAGNMLMWSVVYIFAPLVGGVLAGLAANYFLPRSARRI